MSDILILGGGPAGAVTALGLTRLGYAVTVVTQPRPFAALEGISERTRTGLAHAGLHHALTVVPPPTPRQAEWNGRLTQANTERLLDRPTLDRALLQDLAEQGVTVRSGRVQKLAPIPSGWQVTVEEQTGALSRWQAGFLVEARGRSAPLGRLEHRRGVATVALLQLWQGQPVPCGSAVAACADGWIWLAVAPNGRRYLQLTLDAASAELPRRQSLADFCHQRLLAMPLAQSLLQDAHPLGSITARASTPILCQQAAAENWLRVGDAALAVDPLSGNGIFQTLSSALLAPTVINTLLQQPQRAELARRFYQQRLEHLFTRFARIGRDFYRQEQRWAAQPFWITRAAWPDDQPAHLPADSAQVRIETRPVVHNGLIEERAVVVTADQPLGIWHLAGLELAPIVSALCQQRLDRTANPIGQLCQRFALTTPTAAQLYSWLQAQNIGY